MKIRMKFLGFCLTISDFWVVRLPVLAACSIGKSPSDLGSGSSDVSFGGGGSNTLHGQRLLSKILTEGNGDCVLSFSSAEKSVHMSKESLRSPHQEN